MALLKAGKAATPAPRAMRQPEKLTGQPALDAVLGALEPMRATAAELDRVERRISRIDARFADKALLATFPDVDDDFWDEGRRRRREAEKAWAALLYRLQTQARDVEAVCRQVDAGTLLGWLALQIPLELADDEVFWSRVANEEWLHVVSPWTEWLSMWSDGREAPF